MVPTPVFYPNETPSSFRLPSQRQIVVESRALHRQSNKRKKSRGPETIFKKENSALSIAHILAAKSVSSGIARGVKKLPAVELQPRTSINTLRRAQSLPLEFTQNNAGKDLFWFLPKDLRETFIRRTLPANEISPSLLTPDLREAEDEKSELDDWTVCLSEEEDDDTVDLVLENDDEDENELLGLFLLDGDDNVHR